MPGNAAPLAGITVLSFEQAVAAPYCTRLLADLGARVIKVERPETGDFTRRYDEDANGMSTYFVWLNRNKESLTLDLKDPASAPVLDALLDKVDVVVQNLAPGAAARSGIDAETLVARRPHLIAVDMSGYGADGPNAERRAYDLLVVSEAGAAAATGWPGRPAKPGVPVADCGSGMTAAMSVLAALNARHVHGRGAALEVTMFDVVADLLGFALLNARYTGRDWTPNGMSTPTMAPYGAYPSRDGKTVVLGTTNNQEWERLTRRLLGRPDLAENPAYGSNFQRCDHREEIDAEIAKWTLEHDAEEILRLADDAGIGNARYRTVREAGQHSELVERDRWQSVGSPVGPVASLLGPFHCADWPQQLRPVPDVGEHTAAILAELDLSTEPTRS